jgi:peptidoglycan/LPS O-acetylase OafA/YrhL
MHALDGLRGIAALIVVVHHALLTSRSFAAAHDGRPISAAILPGPLHHWLTFSPLHLLWAGHEAVEIFFVLSGVVLALPYVGGARIDLNQYYPKRLVRLYVPVWGALAFSSALRVLVPHQEVAGGGWWLNWHTAPLGAALVGRQALLVFGAGSPATNTALWSLTWEVLFSLLLPFFVTMVLIARGRPVLLGLGLTALSAIAEASPKVPEAIRFFPMFGLGILLAFELPRLRALRARIAASPSPGLVWAALGAACALLLTARWCVAPLLRDLSGRAAAAAYVGGAFLELAGATLAVALTIAWDGWREQMERPVWQWAGRHSYSVYLLHEPIVVSLAFLLGVTDNPLPVLALGMPISLLAAAAFYRWVEAPSMKLASSVGRRSGQLALTPPRADRPPSPSSAP